MFSETNDYYFRRALQSLQSNYNQKNTATILRIMYNTNPGKQKHLNKIILEKTFAMHFTKFTEINLWWIPFSLKSLPGTLMKKSPSQMFLYDFCKVFQNRYSIERWWTVVFEGTTYKSKLNERGQLITRTQ